MASIQRSWQRFTRQMDVADRAASDPDEMPIAALLTGLAAGYAVALPLGAIGVLLLHEGMTRGARPAAAGAVGVAVVDALYAVCAVVGGGWVATVLGGHEAAVRLVAAVVLGAVAVGGIVRTLRSEPGLAPVGPDGAAGLRLGATFARFVALTAVNPLTALAFVALAAGFTSRWPTAIDGAAFVVGVAVASLGWQLALAGTGGLLGRWTRTGAGSGTGARRALGLVGFGLTAVLAALLAAG
ncbi:LysE family transporter [Pengzhenrongella frigida]|uniref:Lysine transporter LysE n=1 Tax=Pengzhenrongella frigida TaxID=1259133 RepID=A0A4Q5MY71_9MICO|nr:LysE family transporter [Cellulomonas sp. HLT2-17]RYV50615.1 lysine transporter LysE [Cellulomonas sp. HLT2-17]